MTTPGIRDLEPPSSPAGILAPEPGLLAWLRRMLVRFELNREDAVIELLPARGNVLDIGCGPGRLLVRAGPLPGRRFGLDTSLDCCRRARAALSGIGTGGGVVQGTINRTLPFADRSFDVVTAVAVLQFAVEPVACLSDIRRVLRPEGQLVLQVPNLAFLPRRLTLLTGHLPRTSFAPGWAGGTLHGFTRRALIHLLRISGFRTERVTGSGIFAPLRRWWPSLLCGDLIAVARPVDAHG